MPSQLSQLFRFFRHEERGENPIWIVSSAPYDSGYRIYRIMYNDVENKYLNIDTEIIISIEKKWKPTLEPIISIILKIQEETNYTKEFRNTCLIILKDDPWIEDYMEDICTILTKNLQSPCNDIFSVV